MTVQENSVYLSMHDLAYNKRIHSVLQESYCRFAQARFHLHSDLTVVVGWFDSQYFG